MRLKILFSCLLIQTFLFADILSNTQKSIIQNEKKQNSKNSDILQFDWVNPINGSYAHSKSDMTTPSQKSDTFNISLNQPIFRSGGIYYAIKYAKANREFLNFVTTLKEKSLKSSAISLLVSLKSLDLQIQKQKLLIKNSDIDIIRKKEQYLSGVLDSSFLDNALLNKNNLQIALLDLEAKRVNLINSFHVLSSKDYKTVEPPHLKLINLDNFIKDNLIVKKSLADIKQMNYLKNMTISNYLPKLSIFANYNKVKNDNGLITSKDSYKQYGFSVSMPLFDINRGKNIELQRLKYLKSKLELIKDKKSERELYKATVEKIRLYKKKIEIAKVQKKLYLSLLKTTKDLFDAGEKTKYDVQTLENSLKRVEIDKKIYYYDIDKLLLDLYEHVGS